MEPSYRDQTQCPCCKECRDCKNTDFQKVVDLKKVGLVIYHHTTHTENVNQGSGLIEFAMKTTADVFILNNTKNMEITSADYMPEIEPNTINCPRCRKIVEHAQKLLQKVSIINKNDVKGICEHCKTKNKPCFICDEVVKKFVASKTKQAENTKERIKQWLFKIKKILKDAVVDNKIGQERVRAHSELYIDQLCREVPNRETDVEVRDPDVEQMFQPEIDRLDFLGAFEPSLESRIKMFAHIPQLGKLERLNVNINLSEENNVEDRDKDNVSDVNRNYLKAMFYASLIEGGNQKKDKHVTLIDHIPPVPFQSEESVITNKETTKFDKTLRPMSRYRQSHKEPNAKMKHFSKEILKGEIYQRPEIILADKHKNKEKVSYELHQRNASKGLYSRTGESPYSIRKYHSEKDLLATTATDTDHILRQDFSYVFPKMIPPDKNKLKRHKSSSELIRDTQDMLLARAEYKKKILEEEEREKIKKKLLQKEKNSTKAERKKHLEGKKETYEENNDIEVIEKDHQKEYEISILTDKKEIYRRNEKINVSPTSSKSEINEGRYILEMTRQKEQNKSYEQNELKDLKGPKERIVPKELKGSSELIGTKDLRELKGPKELIVQKGLKELKGLKEFKEVREPKELKEPKDLKELMGQKELKDQKRPKDLKELKELIESKEPKNLKGPKEPKDSKLPIELKTPKDLKKPKSPKVMQEPKFSKPGGSKSLEESQTPKEPGGPKGLGERKDIKEPKVSKETRDSKLPWGVKEQKGSKEPKESKLDKDTLKTDKYQDKKEKVEGKSKKEKESLKKEKDEQLQSEKVFKNIEKDLQQLHKDKFQENSNDNKQKGKELSASKQYDRDDKSKRTEKNVSDEKAKEGDKVQPESDKDFKTDLKSLPEKAKEVTNVKDIKAIKVRKPSPDDLILQLVRLKNKNAGERKPKRLSDLKLDKKDAKGPKHYQKTYKTGPCFMYMDSDNEPDVESIISLKEKDKLMDIIIGSKIFKRKLPKPVRQEDKAKQPKTHETDKRPTEEANLNLKKSSDSEADTNSVVTKSPKDNLKEEKTTVKDLQQAIDIKSIKIRKPSHDDLIIKLVKLKQATSGERKPKRLLNAAHTEKEINTVNVYHKANQTDADLYLDSGSDSSFDSASKDSHEIRNIIIGSKIVKQILKIPKPIDRKHKSKRAENIEAENKTKEAKHNNLKDGDVDAIPKSETPRVDTKMEHTTAKDIDLKLIKVRKPSPDDLILQLVKLKQSKSNQIGRRLDNVLESIINKEATIHKGNQTGGRFMYLKSNVELSSESHDTLVKDKDEIADIIIGPDIIKHKDSLSDRQNVQKMPIVFQSTFEDVSDSVIKEDTTSLLEKPPVLTSVKQEDQEPPKGVIRYALSDRSFIDKGWTMLPTEKVVRKMNVYRMRPAQPQFDWFEHNKNKRVMEYDSGEKLAEFSDNGRGRWFYRNGRMALDYYNAEELNAQQRFVIYSSGEPDERGRAQPYTLLATFDYLGNGIVFDHSGKIRLKYNQTEGVVLDRSIGPVSNWKWHTLNDPPVLQQVMIDTQMAHKDPDILKLGGPPEGINRPDNEDMLAIEFDNFVKEKSKKLTQTFKPFQIKMKALKINQQFSLRVLDQATVYLIFRDGTTNLKLNIGMVLDHKEIVDTDTAEVGEVSSSMERFPARTDSLAGLQKSIAHAQHYDRMRTERESRIRPTMPTRSVDKLVSAVSRPMRPPLRAGPSNSATTVSDKYKCRRKPSSSNVYYDTRFC